VVPLGQLKISGVISGESKALGQTHRRGPCLICRLVIEADRQSPQEPGQTMPSTCVETATPLGNEQAVHRFEWPEPGRQCA
jgi:hypothetical protein